MLMKFDTWFQDLKLRLPTLAFTILKRAWL